MRNASGHNYWNSSFIIDVAMGQIPRSTERISSLSSMFSRGLKSPMKTRPIRLLSNNVGLGLYGISLVMDHAVEHYFFETV